MNQDWNTKSTAPLLAFAAAIGSSGCPKTAETGGRRDGPMTYPDAPRGDVVDDYFGTSVADPYRWMEDTDAPAVRAWIDAENALTRRYLDAVPARDAIHARVEKLWNYERYSLPIRRNKRSFYLHNDGLQNLDVLYVAESDGRTRVLLDPNGLSADGTVSIPGVSPSEDGRYLAWGASDGGSDWTIWRVRDVATGQDLPDELRWVKFSSPAWTHDSSGFFYTRYPQPTDVLTDINRNNQVWYHQVGSAQSADVLVYERTDHPEWSFGTTVTEDGGTLLITVYEGTAPRNRVYRMALGEDRSIKPLFDDFKAQYSYISSVGDDLLFITNLDAPRGRVIAVNPANPAAVRTLIAQGEDTIEDVERVGDALIVQHLKDAHSTVEVYNLDGSLRGAVPLPGLGTTAGFSGRAEDTDTWYMFTSFTAPPRIYHYDLKTGASELYRSADVDFHPEDYVTEQVFYTSKDGTRVPMFLNYKKGLQRDGQRPVLLYGYGGFNIPLTPAFSPAVLVWMELGGVYVVANLRGGGEYGEDWHEAGTGAQKQNVFDDFVAAAERLIADGLTCPARLAIKGGSNGGLLVGAMITQRPDLFGAALPGVGVMDMLRYHEFTIGRAWASDYGTSDDSEMFPVLLAYSPLHNLVQGRKYPATLVTTGDHDDRVVPAHSFKFAAALQHAQGGPAPTLIRVETRGGHGRQSPTPMRIDLIADEWAFLVRNLGMEAEPAP